MCNTSNWTLADRHFQLIEDLTAYDNLLDLDDVDEINLRKIMFKVEEMNQELAMVKECMSLKYAVDCDCFYTGNHHQ